ncbi:hypothetical protein OHB05_39990 [Streptomyces sp. NBC_00638]|uniref:hypothetical protein n=1 Tax=Streptomyces sp. NBC_00638 TaxID=2975794 RepID=UPI0022516DDB|nr:hypothetical protein [Streptomyces sp. NBC_00638]MCX5008710.1 hypothetical protein [Streptomyces sp. NBC_00638]
MTAPAADTPGRPSPEPAYRILLIEDDQVDAVLVEELLQDTGLRFELTTRTTLAEAPHGTRRPRDRLHPPRPPFGTETIAAVRELAPHTAVIVFTGLSETQAGAEAMAAGAHTTGWIPVYSAETTAAAPAPSANTVAVCPLL